MNVRRSDPLEGWATRVADSVDSPSISHGTRVTRPSERGELVFSVESDYSLRVKPRRLLHRGMCTLVLAVLVLASFSVPAKPIKLRNFIIPEKSSASRPSQSAAAKSPGLCLIQFRAALQPDQRKQLESVGVDLLHYVPDDTFLARLRGVSLAQIQAFPFVEWAGPYDARLKLHRQLQSAAQSKTLVSAPLNVAVLLAPDSTAAEIAQARQPFSSVSQQGSTRFGTVLRGQVSSGQLNALAASDAVLWIEPFHPMKLVDEGSSSIVAGSGAPNELYTQTLGYDGRGVAVAVADSGLNNGDAATMHPDFLAAPPTFFITERSRTARMNMVTALTSPALSRETAPQARRTKTDSVWPRCRSGRENHHATHL